MSRRLLIVLILSVAVHASNIQGASIYILDEAKNAGCAMAMYQQGEWVVPTFNGELRTDKPPLHYFFMIAAYHLFGVHAFSARIFSSLMGVLTILSVFFFVRRIVDEQSAFLTSLILISSIQLAVQFHLAVPDPYLLFFLTTGWLSFYYGWASNKKIYCWIFYVCTAFACLAKGPIALGFSGLLVLIFLLSRRSLTIAELARLRFIDGVLIFCVVTLPWYILVGIETNGEWLDQFFFKHNVSRFTKTMEGHGGFPMASFVILLGGLMPFSFFIPQMVMVLWREQRQNPFVIFCGVAALMVVVFFAFSRTILPTYPEPAFPFAAILLGIFLSPMQDQKNRDHRFWINGLVYLLISMLIPVAVFIALQNDHSLAELTYLSYAFMILPTGAVIGLIFILRSDLRACIRVYAGSMILFILVFFYYIFPLAESRNPVKQSMPFFSDQSRPIVYFREFNPAYVFAFGKSVPGFNSAEEINEFQQQHPGFYLITQKEYLPELERFGLKLLYEGKDLFEDPVTVVLEKTP